MPSNHLPAGKSLSRPEIVIMAACPTCCAMRGEPCTFARCDDPHLLRTAAGQSHPARKAMAEKKSADAKKELAARLRAV